MINEENIMKIDLSGYTTTWQTSEWGSEDNLSNVLIIMQHTLRQTDSLAREFSLEDLELWLIRRHKEALAGGARVCTAPARRSISVMG